MSTASSADGTTIGYEAVGSGPTLILVEGAMSSRGGSASQLAPELADAFTTVAYDRRGRGGSTDTLPFSVDREIEDIDALIEAVGAPAVAFGMSSGAMLLLRAAAALGPERISAIVLYEPPLMPDAALDGARQYTADLAETLADGRRGDAVALFLARVGMPEQAIDGMRHSPAWPGMEAIAPTLAYDDAAMGDSAVPDDVVQRVRIPVLTLAGGASPAFLQYGARELAAAIPGAAFEVVEDQSHSFAPDAVAAPVRRFLAPRLQ